MTPIAQCQRNESTTLELYLSFKEQKFKDLSGPVLGGSDIESLKSDLERLSLRINSFLSTGSETQDSHLILGKVQSGKTAHMLGVVAGLVDSSCSLVVLLSGVTGQLNRQTKKRLEEDIVQLPDHRIDVHSVPTSGDLTKSSSAFLEDIKLKVERRMKTDPGSSKVANLPVLAILESSHRVKALRQIIDALYEDYKEKLTVVIIDDEADQASPNAKAKKGGESKIYGLLKEIRESGVRNCLLSYTATPQAVLLASRKGALRPRRCSVLSTGKQYFGIESVTSERFAERLIELSDVPTEDQKEAPGSLRDAFLDFLIVGCIRRLEPELFFGCDERIDGIEVTQSSGVQMFIHPSKLRQPHAKYYQWIKKIKDEVEKSLGERIANPDPQFIIDELQPAYERVLKRSGVRSEILDIPPLWITDITAALVGSTGIVVVNSDPDKPTDGISMPDNDDDWDLKEQWVLIGGDILGRGVTIPNLVSTYFLRAPNKTLYDTLSQQMRFCGYRTRYQDFIYVYAPGEVISRFKEAERVDRVLFKYATNWDKTDVDLIRNPPEVIYAQGRGSRLSPTRPSVLDKNIDHKSINDLMFVPNRILNPNTLLCNAEIAKDFIDSQKKNFTTKTNKVNWNIYSDVLDSEIKKLFEWQCIGSNDSNRIRAARIAFHPELEEAGLSDLQKIVAIGNSDLVSKISASKNADALFSEEVMQDIAHRSLLKSSRLVDLSGALTKWKNLFNQPDNEGPSWILSGEIGYVGDPQRKLRDNVISPQLGECVIFAIEPIYVYSKPKREGGEVIGLGMELLIMAPKDFALVTWRAKE